MTGREPDKKDRVDAVSEKKAKLLEFEAEHSLPLSIVPDLIDLCKVGVFLLK